MAPSVLTATREHWFYGFLVCGISHDMTVVLEMKSFGAGKADKRTLRNSKHPSLSLDAVWR